MQYRTYLLAHAAAAALFAFTVPALAEQQIAEGPVAHAATPTSAPTATAEATPAEVRAPIVKFKTMTRDIVVEPDGSWTVTSHGEMQVMQESAVASMSQDSLQYSETLQTLEVKEAYTLKANGQKLPVGPDAILTQQASHTGNMPLYTDNKVKVIIYPNVEVGDTLVRTIVTRVKPQLAGQFTYDTVVPPPVYVENMTTSVTVPASIPLTVDARGVDVTTTPGNGRITYTMHYANPHPVLDDNQPLSQFDRAPRFSVSSFKSYDELAAAYAALAEPKMAITPAIQQKADEITAGVKSEREQARKLYDWVALHIRYVAIEFGLGSIVPHEADRVLANGYGDCKDHAVLFAALLRSKGIRANLVIINGSSSYSVSAVPTLGAFNHMITWIPDLKLYADTTSRTLPFGFLSRTEYGKPAVHVADKVALHHTPVMTPKDATVHYTATDTIVDDAGHIKGTGVTTATGMLAGFLRSIGGLIQADQSNKLAGDILKTHGMPNATGSYSVPPTMTLDDSYAVSGSYATAKYWYGVAKDEPFRLPDGLHLVVIGGSVLLGDIGETKFKGASAVPCNSAHAVEDYALEFPASLKAGTLPVDGTVKSAHFSYSSQWSSNAHSISVHREFTANFPAAICTTAIIDEAHSSIDRIRADLSATVRLMHVAPIAPATPQ